MIDNKMCNAATGTSSSMRCYIFNAKPPETNNLELVKHTSCNINSYSFGTSTLHAWIRTFEFLLHVAYNIPFKKWAANTPELKQLQRVRKEKIQKLFREKMSLLVDFAKQGWGSSKDGNTSRRFFANVELSAEITKIYIVENALFPIGQLSEEAQESRHKNLKKYRTQSSRKMSTIVTNEDVFNKLLCNIRPIYVYIKDKIVHQET